MNKEKRRHKYRVAISTVLAFFILSSVSWAATYYVDGANGDDTHPGTSQSQAWRTISRVNAQTFSPGDFIYFQRGSSWNETLYPDSGTSGSVVTYGSYGSGNKPVISSFNVNNKSYIEAQNIEFRSSGAYNAVHISNSDYITLRGCNIYAETSSTVYVVLLITMNSEYNRVIGCDIKHMNTGRQTDAFDIKLNSNFNLIENNTIGTATHYAISTQGCSDSYPDYEAKYNVIRNNIINNPTGALIALGICSNNNLVESNNIINGKSTNFNNNKSHAHKVGGKDNIIRRNLLYGNNGLGITLVGFKYGNYPPRMITGNHIYNNTLSDIAHDPIFLTYYADTCIDCKLEDNYFINNISMNSNYQLVIRDVDNIKDYHVYNNVFYKPGTTKILDIKGNYYSVAGIETSDPAHFSGNMQISPQLGADYRPTSNSPIVNAGAFLTTIMSQSGSGTIFTVSDSKYFMDGWGIIEGDLIQLEGQSKTARITNIDYANNTITVDTSLSWVNGQGVGLPYQGSAPDIGAFEYVPADSMIPPSPPANLQIVDVR